MSLAGKQQEYTGAIPLFSQNFREGSKGGGANYYSLQKEEEVSPCSSSALFRCVSYAQPIFLIY